MKTKDSLKEKIHDATALQNLAGSFNIEVTKAGAGPIVKKGDMVEMNYTGTLLDGTVFDSSITRGETYKFKLGAGQVIQCWEKGVAQMSKGEKAVFTCPSTLAYGHAGIKDLIPADATLKFEVEMVNF